MLNDGESCCRGIHDHEDKTNAAQNYCQIVIEI